MGLLVDSSITEMKRPLLFDCGTVGLSVMPQDFVSRARAICVEGLAKDERGDQGVAVSQSCQADANGEIKVAMQATPNTTMQGQAMPVCGPPRIFGPESGSKLAEVQQPVRAPSSGGNSTMGC